ncbi:YjbH domain-containing protein [Pseudoalteromonas gelatinilytica]
MLKANTLLISGLATLCTPVLASDKISNYQSFTGYTGLINTPNASVIDVGHIDIGYNNMLDLRGRKYVDGHNFIFSAGLFDGLEVSGQIAAVSMNDNLFYTEGKGQLRDLSFNAKYQIPYIPKDWFTVAVGAKDIGGAANNYETYYAVASKELWDFRFSAGYAVSDRISGQMDGPFAGVEWQPFEWFALQAEHDADAFNAAAKVTIPKKWLYDIGELTLTSRFYSNTDYSEEDTSWGVNFKMPLFTKPEYEAIESAPEPVVSESDELAYFKLNANKEPVTIKDPNAHRYFESNKEMTRQAATLKHALVKDGFESVQVGFNNDKQIAVKFENSVFNRNDLDAIGLVLGRVAQYVTSEGAEFNVLMSKQDIPQLSLKGQVDEYREFIVSKKHPEVIVYQGAMPLPRALTWVGLMNTSTPYFKPRVSLSPVLRNNYATELGVYDFSFAVRADVDVPLWQGAGLNLGGQVHVADSDDYEKDAPFRYYREESEFDRATLYQTFALPYGIYNQTQIGYFKDYQDYMGIQNETTWLSPEGRHKVSANIGYFDYQDFDANKDTQVVSYQFNWVEQDITLHAEAGNYFYDDSGFKVESRFWFGDSYLAVYAQDTSVRKIGFAFSIPLTPRKDMNVSRYGQVKGNQAWRHVIDTQVGQSHNNVVFNRAYMPFNNISLDRKFLNQGRLSKAYVYANFSRLRDVYLEYK